MSSIKVFGHECQAKYTLQKHRRQQEVVAARNPPRRVGTVVAGESAFSRIRGGFRKFRRDAAEVTRRIIPQGIVHRRLQPSRCSLLSCNRGDEVITPLNPFICEAKIISAMRSDKSLVRAPRGWSAPPPGHAAVPLVHVSCSPIALNLSAVRCCLAACPARRSFFQSSQCIHSVHVLCCGCLLRTHVNGELVLPCVLAYSNATVAHL